MLDIICITAAEFAAKASQAGIVTAIGVGLVFVILGLLIGIVQILKFVDVWLNAWDAHMLYVRECKSEIKKIKAANSNRFTHEKNAIIAAVSSGEMTKEQADSANAKVAADKATAKIEFSREKKQIHIKYDTVFNVLNEANFRIKRLIKAENAEYTATLRAISGDNKKQDIAALKTARVLKRVELDKLIAIEKTECNARIALAKAGLPVPANESHGSKVSDNNEQSNVTDGKVIAAITAAITMMMSEEGAAKKASFKVRSIKLVK